MKSIFGDLNSTIKVKLRASEIDEVAWKREVWQIVEHLWKREKYSGSVIIIQKKWIVENKELGFRAILKPKELIKKNWNGGSKKEYWIGWIKFVLSSIVRREKKTRAR